MTTKPRDPHSDPSPSSNNDDEKARCYVCETDLTPSAVGKKLKNEKEKGSKEQRGVVELRSEGTGFAGGGKNIAKREGVAFQC